MFLTLLVGVVYFIVGRAFSVPTEHTRAWRLAAWVVSGAAFAAHIGYEHFRLRHSTRPTSWHAAVAVAFGAFLLAAVGALHSLLTATTTSPLWLLALVAWPAVTAVPAYLVAVAVSAVLARLERRG
jgi:hypothetical protein